MFSRVLALLAILAMRDLMILDVFCNACTGRGGTVGGTFIDFICSFEYLHTSNNENNSTKCDHFNMTRESFLNGRKDVLAKLVGSLLWARRQFVYKRGPTR